MSSEIEMQEQQLKIELIHLNELQLETTRLKKAIDIRKLKIRTLQEAELNKLKNKLEEEGLEKVSALQKTNLPMEGQLTAIMKDGFNEFEKKTGRAMTYGEMRELYG